MEKWTPENAVGRLQAELSGVEAKVEVRQGYRVYVHMCARWCLGNSPPPGLGVTTGLAEGQCGLASSVSAKVHLVPRMPSQEPPSRV